MHFGLDEDQRELQGNIRSFLERSAPVETLMGRLDAAAPHDEEVWRRIVSELELTGLAVPEAYGGSGFTLFETCIVLSEMGRVLYDGPFFATVILAASALLASDDEEAKQEYLPGLVSGERLGTFADGDPSSAAETLQARGANDAWVLNGRATYVLDGERADLVIVAAQAERSVDCFAVAGDAAGLAKSALPAMDLTRPLAQLEFEDVAARRLGPAGQGSIARERVRQNAAVGLAAEQVGAAEASLEMAVEYAKQRHQFGRPIGSFQALKHRCASVYVTVEAAKAAALYAAWAVSREAPDLATVASLTKACCSDALYVSATSAIQVYGGIGFTWEHPAHLFLRRAVSSRELFGSPTYHRERVGAWLAA